MSPFRSAFLFLLPLAAGLAPASAAPVTTSGCGGPASATRLYVNVDNVRSAQGLIAISLYADIPRKFLAKRGALYVVRVPARTGRTRVCIHVPAPGVYAVAAYHDRNSNRSYDRTGLGLPAEPNGFSNNPGALLGMPAFASVRLRVNRDMVWTTIRLRNP